MTYDSDGLNAFSGVITAASRSLGQFHWGLPVRIIARALLLHVYSTGKSQDPPAPRPGFPSWSWLSWKTRVENIFYGPYQLRRLVHLYAYHDHMRVRLLSGP